MKIVTIVGARPQFIKAAAVSRALASRPGVKELIVHTGQHHDQNMSDVFFSELELPVPDYNLGISGGTHGVMTGRMLTAIEEVLMADQPDCLLVYGDTNSTLAGALASSKLYIPIAHVEAGLRSFNRRMPEEINRVMTDHVATWLLTPTDTATENLLREGISADNVYQVGDVMYDAAMFYASKAEQTSTILTTLGLDQGGYVLATIHRQENTDALARLGTIITGLNDVARDIPVVLPLHPRTRQLLESTEGFRVNEDLRLVQPVGYLDMVMLERGAAVIATDSGGVQKEAFFHRTPCVTLRDETEWIELIDLGWNRLAPPEDSDIAGTIRAAIGRTGEPGNPYGEGQAALKIAATLLAN